MYKKQISILYTMVMGLTLVALALAGINLLSLPVVAQEPATDLVALSPAEKLALFGLPADELQPAGVITYNLQTVKQTNAASVTSGSLVAFTVAITNLGPNPASYFVFYDTYPSQMKNVAFTFSTPAISGNLFNQQLWLFTNTLPVNNQIVVTVTGILTSAPDVKVKNTATAMPLDPTNEIITANNTSEVSVFITGYVRTSAIYLPVIYKGPPTVTLYLDNFSSTSSEWAHNVTDTACKSYYENNRYMLAFKDTDTSCWRPTPDNAIKNLNPVYVAVQIEAMRRSGSGNVAYGIYMNGKGGSEYYLFKVWPYSNSCRTWELYRKTSRVKSGCDSSNINNGAGVFNRLKIKHASNGQISVYVNDALLGTYTDSSQLTGWGAGVYGYSDDTANNSSAVVEFDNFTIFDR